MGMIRAEIELGNPTKPELKPLTVEALVDTGAMTICIPEHVAVQLGLETIETREVTTADEKSHVVPYVGPLRIRFEKRSRSVARAGMRSICGRCLGRGWNRSTSGTAWSEWR